MTGVPFRHRRDFLRFYGPWRAIRFVRSGSPDSGVGGEPQTREVARKNQPKRVNQEERQRCVYCQGGEDFGVSYAWPGIRLFLL